MNRLTITAGTGFTRDGDTLPPEHREEALALIRARMARDFGGYTEQAAQGGWIDPEGTLVVESSKVWTLYGDIDYEDVIRISDFVRLALRQHTVIAAADPMVNVRFIAEEETAGA